MSTQDCKVRWVGPHAVVAMPAEIDAVNAEKIRQGLLSAASLGAAVVVIDMSGTTFCDSAGVQAIIAAYQQAAADGTELRLVATAVLRILTVVGVGPLVPIYPGSGPSRDVPAPGQHALPRERTLRDHSQRRATSPGSAGRGVTQWSAATSARHVPDRATCHAGRRMCKRIWVPLRPVRISTRSHS
jgi:anti-sigma B factor antagonist